MVFNCDACKVEFEYSKGCAISYGGIKCKPCNEKEIKEYNEKAKLREEERNSLPRSESYAFRSFYDQSLGIMIDSAETKRQVEKENNVTYVSNSERKAIVKDAKDSIKRQKSYKYRQKSKEILDNVHRGHSYVNELNRRVNNG